MSFPNSFIGEGQAPSVERGCSEILWSDRNAYFINEVSKDGKEIVIERPYCNRTDNNGMCESQTYEFHRVEGQRQVRVRKAYGSWWVLDEKGKRTRKMRLNFSGMYEYYDFSF